MAIELRKATNDDVPQIEALMRDSIRGLCPGFYDDTQIESTLRYTARLDPMLVEDRGFFVAVDDEDGAIVACGGWSARAKLYAGSAPKGDERRMIDPQTEPARIRAMFVHPRAARRGLGRRILQACEDEARAAGFKRTVLVAMLSGEDLYRKTGYAPVQDAPITLQDGVVIGGTLMEKAI
ncbi:MAG TPA: GNAT family N-acetyltransferase [Thermoanaerobaculia bacterium]|nr:GNAT family N-acetyltransferase [Thermoanaerobaculia bacterium]